MADLENLEEAIEESVLNNSDQEREEIQVESDFGDILGESYSSRVGLTLIEPFDHMWVVDDLLDPEECHLLIQRTEEIGYGRTGYIPLYRGNLRLICDDIQLADKLWIRVQQLLGFDFYLNDQYGRKWIPVGLNPRFRYAKYYPGDQFGRHADDCYQDKSTKQVSMLTVNIYLNKCDSGATRFYYYGNDKNNQDNKKNNEDNEDNEDEDNDEDDDEDNEISSGKIINFHNQDKSQIIDILPESGKCVIFRQLPEAEYIHAGLKVESGLKYLMRTDVMFRML